MPTLALAAGALALAPQAAQAAAGDYLIDGVANSGTTTLQQDINALPSAPATHTIKLQTNVTADQLVFGGGGGGDRIITFDLNGHNLTATASAAGSWAIQVSGANTVVNYTGTGNFTAVATGDAAGGLYSYDGTITLTGVSSPAAARAMMNNGTVTVNGNVNGGNSYVSSGGTLTVNGDVIYGGTSYAVSASTPATININGNVTGGDVDTSGSAATVHVTGDITAPGIAISMDGGHVIVDGNVISNVPSGGSSADGIWVRGGSNSTDTTVDIGGNLTHTVAGTCSGFAIRSSNAIVKVAGDVSSNCAGVSILGTVSGSSVTIDGKLTAPDAMYIVSGPIVKGQADKTIPTSKTGYNTYFGTAGVDDGTSVVWIKKLSSDAVLDAVDIVVVTPGPQAGDTPGTAKQATVTFTSCVTSIALSDLSVSTGATATMYSNSTFMTVANTITINSNGSTHLYVKVVAADGTTVYYDVTVKPTCAAVPSSDAGLGTVGGSTVPAGTGTGATPGAAKVSTVTLATCKASIALSDITTTDSGATAELYSDAAFTATATTSITINPNGSTHVYVKVTAADKKTVLYYDVTVKPTCAAGPTMVSTLPDGMVGATYPSTKVTSTPGATCSLKTGSTLPPGLLLAADGTVSGTPTTAGTSYTFTIQCTAGGATTEQTYTMKINPAGTAVLLGALPNGTVSKTYPTTVVTVTAGATCSVTTGALPDGLTLDSATCTIAGTPNKAGTFNFTIKATTTAGDVTQGYTVVISPLGGGGGNGATANVPTLSQWALMLLAAMLGFVALAWTKRREQ